VIFSKAGWLKTGFYNKSSAVKALDKLGKNGFFWKFRKKPLFCLCFLGNQEINQFEFLSVIDEKIFCSNSGVFPIYS